MNSFIVMQGETYNEERKLGILWSPQRDKGGLVPHSWKRMTEVEEGDRVFHYVKGNIIAISIAREGCKEAKKPSTIQNPDKWNDDGYLVHLEYHELDKPLHVRDHFKEISPLLPIKYSPFQHDGDGNSGYLYPCNEELVLKLLEFISELNIYQVREEQLEFGIDVVRHTEHNTLIPVLAETESETITKMRRGQQRFKKELLPLWEGKCALCGIDQPQLVKASYSKPWRDSTDEERLDPYNGLLLCLNHDALYTNGFITFDGQGRLHISAVINEVDYLNYWLDPKTKIKVHADNKPYFKWHRKNIFKMN
ncbi:HNH endonuclease [Mesobacillus foraminis]|uniref:HNH endonuclease n=1 Tax=Mesobacillus foraminis TaxID=279826 RepID=UPI001BE52DAE|nr:HNH endonuclease [Mesobacillus foraminis]MBT2759276.1 HNH endonuclease [Mesobacillus foraminis]